MIAIVPGDTLRSRALRAFPGHPGSLNACLDHGVTEVDLVHGIVGELDRSAASTST